MNTAAFWIISAKQNDPIKRTLVLKSLNKLPHTSVAKPKKLRIKWSLGFCAKMATKKASNTIGFTH
ncbi:hypothetical protein BH09VER1_BH09VER1_03010 [soil metagenome]